MILARPLACWFCATAILGSQCGVCATETFVFIHRMLSASEPTATNGRGSRLPSKITLPDHTYSGIIAPPRGGAVILKRGGN